MVFGIFCCKRRWTSGELRISLAMRILSEAYFSWQAGCTSATTKLAGTQCRAGRQTTPTPCKENKKRELMAPKDLRKPHCDIKPSVSYATNKEIINSAWEGPEVLRDLVLRYVKQRKPLSAINLATIFHRAAKYPYILSPDVLEYLTSSLRMVTISGQVLGNIGYGLQGLKNTDPVNDLVTVLALKTEETKEELTVQQIANALYGLKGMTDSPAMRQYLRALEPKLRGITEAFVSQAIGNCCFGLQQLGDSPEVRSILAAVADRLEEGTIAKEVQDGVSNLPLSDGASDSSLKATLMPKVRKEMISLDGQAISNALYGMHTLGDTPETRRLLALISIQLNKVARPLKAQEVAIALYGLRCFQSTPDEVRRFLVALVPHFGTCVGRFEVKHISSSACGLRWLGDCDETRMALAALTEKVRKNREPFDGQTIGNCLYGMQSFGCSKEALGMLEALRPHIEQFKLPMSSQQLGTAFYGFRTVGDSLECRGLLLALTPKLRQCKSLDPQAISNLLYGCHELGRAPQIKSILKVLQPLVTDCKQPFNSQVFANSFYGLHSVADSEELRDLVTALGAKLEDYQNDLKPEYLAIMYHNVRAISDCEGVRRILAILEKKIVEANIEMPSSMRCYRPDIAKRCVT
jgi:hypothetical protein